MTDSSIEERLTRTLEEVAGRIAARHRPFDSVDTAAPQSWTGRRRWAVGVAAALVVVVGLGAGLLLTLASKDRDAVSVPAGEGEILLTAMVGGDSVALRLTNNSSDRCVDIQFPPGIDASAAACLSGRPLAIQATLRAGSTVVYGIGEPGARFSISLEGDVAELHQTRVGEGVAFVAIIDTPRASGTVEVLDRDGRVLAEADFDNGASPRVAKGTIGNAEMLFAFRRDGAVWAALDNGTIVRLSDGTAQAPDGYPFVSPDGLSIFHTVTNFEGIFDTPVVLNARDGSTRQSMFSVTAFSSDGRHAAGVIPADDPGTARDVVVIETTTLSEVARVSIPAEEAGGDLTGLVWDVDGGLLVTSGPRLLVLQPFNQPATATSGRDTSPTSSWMPAKAFEPGRFSALRRTGVAVEFGVLHLDGSTATFERGRQVTWETPEATLDPTQIRFLQPLQGPLEVNDRGHVTRPTGGFTALPAFLVGDGQNLFQLVDGDLSFLISNVDFASAP